MADDILQALHKKFTYVFISADINDPVKEHEFEGTEDHFQRRLKSYFRRIVLGEQGKAEYRDILKETIDQNSVKNKTEVGNEEKENKEKNENIENKEKTEKEENKEKTEKDEKLEKEEKEKKEVGEKKSNEKVKSNSLLEKDTLNLLIESTSSYQIIPLTLPTKETNFFAVNCYIDDVGKLKNLPYNSRASRICNTDIYGDAFISKTYDNEDFKRVDFKIEEYEQYLKNPPKLANRFSLGKNVEALMKAAKAQTNGGVGDIHSQKQNTVVCSNCFKEGKLKKCGKCKKVYYCSVDCQRKDYIFHQRICS